MTRNRAVKQTIRRRASASLVPYTGARQANQQQLPADWVEVEDDSACCQALPDLASRLSAAFGRDGADALALIIQSLADTLGFRDSHYSYGSSHDILLTVQDVCAPLLHRSGVKPASHAPIEWSDPLLTGAEHGRVLAALRLLEDAAFAAWRLNAPY